MKAEDLLRIGALFDSLDWPTDEAEDTPFSYLFDRFCRMWNRLDKPQQNLLLEITKSYVWVKPNNTAKYLHAAWRKMTPLLPPKTQCVAVAPLPKPEKKGPKSFDSIHYLARGYQTTWSNSLHPRRLVFCESIQDFASRFELDPETVLVLVDDYVGTGNTVAKAIKQLRQEYPHTISNPIILLALAAQSKAVAPLETLGCLLVAERLLPCGISDNANLPSIPDALRVMSRLGEQLCMKKKYRLGYQSTEALVTLTRTPNNTFPVYWTNNKVRGIVWDSPFPRIADDDDD